MAAKDRHHLIPRVVCRDLGINPNFWGNVIKVRVSKHRAFHTLFGASTPEQAIDIIRREWSLAPSAQQELARLVRQAADQNSKERKLRGGRNEYCS